MNSDTKISIQELIQALLDEKNIFKPRYLYRLSDLEGSDLDEVTQTWPKVALWRRRALLEDLEELTEQDYLLSFEALSRMALSDPDPEVLMPAIRILWEFESPDLIPIFLKLLHSHDSAPVRASAASALGKYVYLGELGEIDVQLARQVEDELIDVLRGTWDDRIRRSALEALGYSGREDILPLIESAYYQGEDEWLSSALFAMGRSANQHWTQHVIDELDSPAPAVRREAARAAGELELKQAVPALLELLEDVDEQVRLAAIWSLSQIGGEGVQDELEQLLEMSEDEEESEFLETALDNLMFTEEMAAFAIFDFDEDDLDSFREIEPNEDDQTEDNLAY